MFNIDNEFNKLAEELNLPKEEIDIIKKEDKYSKEIVKIEEYLQYIRNQMSYYKNDSLVDYVLEEYLQDSGWTKRIVSYKCQCNVVIKIYYFEENINYNGFSSTYSNGTNNNSSAYSYTTEYISNHIWCSKCGNRINFASSGNIKVHKIKIDLMEGEYEIK